MECLDNVITEQCGEEIANSLHQLGDKLNDHFGCEPQAIPRREYIFAFINRSSLCSGQKLTKKYQLYEKLTYLTGTV